MSASADPDAAGDDPVLVALADTLRRFPVPVGALEELIEGQELGDLFYIYGNRLNLGKLRADENALWSLGAHDVSVALHLIGEEPEECLAQGASFVREGVQDRDDNVTRFVWLAQSESPPSKPPPLAEVESPLSQWKTSVVFWGSGADSPGWLVRCLNEFAQRGINLTKIESRPQRARLGHYMFFADLQGCVGEPTAAQALDGLRAVCEEVRVLGSYRRS